MLRLALLLIGSLTAPSAIAQTATITFGTTDLQFPASYEEQGITFTGGFAIFGAPDGYLYSAAPGASVTAISDVPFDLLGFTIQRLDAQPWTITTSAGGSQQILGAGDLDFTATAGFQGITSFTLSETVGAPLPNIILHLDDVDVTFVPEPSSLALLVLGTVSLGLRRRPNHRPRLSGDARR